MFNDSIKRKGRLRVVSDSRVVFNADLRNSNTNGILLNTELNYSHFLYFKVSIRTNQLVYSQTDKYTTEQQELHDYIKSMHDRGMSYRQITKLLNEKNITTHKGKKWSVSANSVYSVLMKYQQRLKRINFKIKNTNRNGQKWKSNGRRIIRNLNFNTLL